ncbi:MAG: sigma-70 family RNA polymerase sigma factor [Bacteroidales bacterium]|nr:sigma-70 family RNA polymerase sigma factor [Bacteroidales bacterium]
MKISLKSESKENNVDIFKKYFDEYFDDIRNFIYYKCSDIELSEDLSQEVFVKLWERMDSIKPESVRSYLYTIASNLFKNHYNRKKIEFKFISTLEDFDNESPEFIMEFKEFDIQLQKTLSDIPEKSREVFLMNRIDKLTYAEVADRLNISVKAVEKRMKKALEIIRSLTKIKV